MWSEARRYVSWAENDGKSQIKERIERKKNKDESNIWNWVLSTQFSSRFLFLLLSFLFFIIMIIVHLTLSSICSVKDFCSCRMNLEEKKFIKSKQIQQQNDIEFEGKEEHSFHFHSRAVMCLTMALITFNKLRILCLDHKQQFYFDFFLLFFFIFLYSVFFFVLAPWVSIYSFSFGCDAKNTSEWERIQTTNWMEKEEGVFQTVRKKN